MYLIIAAALAIASQFSSYILWVMIIAGIAVSTRLSHTYKHEYLIWIQVCVLAWVNENLLLRMEAIEIADALRLSIRLLPWLLLATLLCHSFYFIAKRLWATVIFGALWGVLMTFTPVFSGIYQANWHWPALLVYSALSGAFILAIVSFVITQRILPNGKPKS